MANGQLFQYAALYHPKATKDQVERGETPKSEIVVDVRTIVATDERQVAMLVARGLPVKYAELLEDVEIVVRPF